MKLDKRVESFGERTNKEKAYFKFQLQLEEGEKSFKDEVHYWKSSCGCTSTEFDQETGVISGYIDLSQVGVNSGQKPVTKYVEIFLDKNESYFKANPKTLERIVNPNKKVLKLQISGIVKHSEV